MSQVLQEYAGWRGSAPEVDASSGVIRGVKVLGLRSRNGRSYRPQALKDAVPLYEGAKVNVNHPQDDPASPRDYRDRLGTIRRVRFVPEEGLFADLHFNPRHPLAEQLTWDAQHAPENVGLSHNVTAEVRQDGDTPVVEAIERVISVDLVADPATSRGLYESRHSDHSGGSDDAEAIARLQTQLATVLERLDTLAGRLAAITDEKPTARDQLAILSERPRDAAEFARAVRD